MGVLSMAPELVTGCHHKLSEHAESISEAASQNSPTFTASYMSLSEGPIFNPRITLVNELLKRVMKFGFLHVRSTPASGKSTTVRLLARSFVANYPGLPVYIVTGWTQRDVTAAGGWRNHLLNLTGISDWLHTKAVLLLDEGQECYWDSELWTALFKDIPEVLGPYVILFSSYGSPGTEPTEHRPKTPLKLPDLQRIGLRPASCASSEYTPVGLILTKEEAIDIINRNVLYNGDPRFSDELNEMLFYLSGGHVGALCSLIYAIVHQSDGIYKIVRHGTTIDISHVRQHLFNSPNLLFVALRGTAFTRGLPKQKDIQKPHIAMVFKKILTGGYLVSGAVPQDLWDGVNECFREGWVHADELGSGAVYYLASHLHRWYIHHLLIPTELTKVMHYKSPLSLAQDAISLFRPSFLSDPPRTLYDQATPPEDANQKEMYRCLYELLYGSFTISPEFIVKHGRGGGTVDFLVADIGWAFELLKDRDHLSEHMNRFKPGQPYYVLLEDGLVKEYIVLDFTTTRPTRAHPQYPQLFHVFFSNNFWLVQIINHNLTLVKELHLLENSM